MEVPRAQAQPRDKAQSLPQMQQPQPSVMIINSSMAVQNIEDQQYARLVMSLCLKGQLLNRCTGFVRRSELTQDSLSETLFSSLHDNLKQEAFFYLFDEINTAERVVKGAIIQAYTGGYPYTLKIYLDPNCLEVAHTIDHDLYNPYHGPQKAALVHFTVFINETHALSARNFVSEVWSPISPRPKLWQNLDRILSSFSSIGEIMALQENARNLKVHFMVLDWTMQFHRENVHFDVQLPIVLTQFELEEFVYEACRKFITFAKSAFLQGEIDFLKIVLGIREQLDYEVHIFESASFSEAVQERNIFQKGEKPPISLLEKANSIRVLFYLRPRTMLERFLHEKDFSQDIERSRSFENLATSCIGTEKFFEHLLDKISNDALFVGVGYMLQHYRRALKRLLNNSALSLGSQNAQGQNGQMDKQNICDYDTDSEQYLSGNGPRIRYEVAEHLKAKYGIDCEKMGIFIEYDSETYDCAWFFDMDQL